MRFGFKLRQKVTNFLELVRRLLDMFLYLFWILLDPSKFKKIDNSKIKNILVIYSGAIGDTYCVLGIINKILERYPYLNFYYLTLKKNRNLIKNPKIKVVTLKETKELIDRKKIDSAVFFTNLPHPDLFDGEFYKKILKVPYRILSISSSITTFFNQIPFLITRRIFPRYKEPIWEQITSFKKLGFSFDRKSIFYHTPESEKNIKKFIKSNKINKDEIIILLHPGFGTRIKTLNEGKISSREWPKERWAELANDLIKKYNPRIVFTGSKEEQTLIKEIISKIKDKKRIINTAGIFSIEDIASLMKKSDLLIGLNSSMVHIGAQAGIPLIDLAGAFPKLISAARTEKKIMLFHSELCNSCRRYACPEENPICIMAITVQEVIRAADDLLKKYKKHFYTNKELL